MPLSISNSCFLKKTSLIYMLLDLNNILHSFRLGNPIYNLTIKFLRIDNLTEQINLLSSHPIRFSPRNFV